MKIKWNENFFSCHNTILQFCLRAVLRIRKNYEIQHCEVQSLKLTDRNPLYLTFYRHVVKLIVDLRIIETSPNQVDNNLSIIWSKFKLDTKYLISLIWYQMLYLDIFLLNNWLIVLRANWDIRVWEAAVSQPEQGDCVARWLGLGTNISADSGHCGHPRQEEPRQQPPPPPAGQKQKQHRYFLVWSSLKLSSPNTL